MAGGLVRRHRVALKKPRLGVARRGKVIAGRCLSNPAIYAQRLLRFQLRTASHPLSFGVIHGFEAIALSPSTLEALP